MQRIEKAFSPEDIKVYGPDGLQFSDAWGLTCAQLGTTVTSLLEVNPNAQLTEEDLIGYHFIQYGMDSDITRKTIDGTQGSMWSGWATAELLRSSLPRILGDETQGALVHRIRLGSSRDTERLRIDPAFNEYFITVTETDHTGREAVSLYPAEGVGVEYRGRTGLHIGRVVIGNVIEDLRTYTDVLDLTAGDGSPDQTIVASSTNLGSSFPVIQSLRLM